MHLMSSDIVSQHVIAFTEKDDNPKAEWWKGITQSLVDDDLVNLAETVERKCTKSRSIEGANPFKIL